MNQIDWFIVSDPQICLEKLTSCVEQECSLGIQDDRTSWAIKEIEVKIRTQPTVY